VRAVNLIPADQRRGAGGIGGRSGGVAYVLTGGLAVVVLLGVVYALAVHNVASKKTQLATVTQQVAAVTSQAQSLEPYVSFAGVSASEVGQVDTLAKTRFDWPDAMRQLALALPVDVTFTGFSATAGSGPGGPDGTTDTSFNLSGCASTQGEIAQVLTNLASVPGVDTVTLSSTAEQKRQRKSGKAAAKTAEPSSGGGCPLVSFAIAVNYKSTYTVPDMNLSKQTGSRSASTPTISTAASQQGTGVKP
jgi:Tfp pilus assembly protein PilN